MAKNNAPEPLPTPSMGLASGYELAKVEAARWAHVAELLVLAVRLEDQEGDLQRRLDSIMERRAKADEEADAAVAASDKRAADAELDALRRITDATEEAVRVEEETRAALAHLEAKIHEKQAELVQIGQDHDAAQQARAEHAGLLAEVQALRTERDALIEKLTR